ncbi:MULTISPECIES: AMP-binding protein [Acinetobacter]|uniref:AMP-binding protein n=1 Tax=Acinetobacter TaxID=469 RepID=UPI0009BCE5D9|nr:MULTISPECIES: AMP-binding protein [Acinetobacter]MCU4473793.1 AMP-binding protein [Acinetobacter bereziniae]
MKKHIEHAWHGGLTTLSAIERFEKEKPLKERIPNTVYQLFVEASQRYGDKTALTMLMTGEDENPIQLSYTELLKQINRTANLFAEIAGSGAGVAYILPALLETQVTLWAAETSGYAVPLNPLLNVEHLTDLLKASQAKILVVPDSSIAPQIWEKAKAIRIHCPDIKVVVISALESKSENGLIDYHQAIGLQSDQKLEFSLQEYPDRVVAYFHTGGTTSAPKLVAHTHINQLTAALGTAALLDIRVTDVLTNGMPMFHVGGTIACSLAFFLSGANILVLSPIGFRNPLMVQRFWKIIENYKVTICAAVPTALSAILEHPINEDLSRVRLTITGSAATPRTLAKRFQSLTGLSLHEILGMTESGGATAVDPAGVEATLGSVGLRLPYTRISVHKRDANGQIGAECAANETGIVVISGPTVSPGYFNDSQLADNLKNDYLDSGDLGHIDEHGRLFLSGRSKDLIIRGGHNIDPALIEEILLSHPTVASAAAVGQPDTYAGERPVCFVALKPTQTITAEELLIFAQKNISERPAWPCTIHILDELPLTAVGKIYKPALRALAALHVIEPMIAEVAGATLLDIKVIDHGAKGQIIEVHLHNAEALLSINEILGQFTINSKVHIAI